MISHTAKFKKGAIMDLCIGKGASPLGSYVAIDARHTLETPAHRLFAKELFAKGEKEGPDTWEIEGPIPLPRDASAT